MSRIVISLQRHLGFRTIGSSLALKAARKWQDFAGWAGNSFGRAKKAVYSWKTRCRPDLGCGCFVVQVPEEHVFSPPAFPGLRVLLGCGPSLAAQHTRAALSVSVPFWFLPLPWDPHTLPHTPPHRVHKGRGTLFPLWAAMPGNPAGYEDCPWRIVCEPAAEFLPSCRKTCYP